MTFRFNKLLYEEYEKLHPTLNKQDTGDKIQSQQEQYCDLQQRLFIYKLEHEEWERMATFLLRMITETGIQSSGYDMPQCDPQMYRVVYWKHGNSGSV